MTIQNIYDLAVRMGIESDLRGQEAVRAQLKRVKEKYEKLSPEDKELFDQEHLTNPYADTRVLWGNLDKPVHRLVCGIDIDTSEMLVAAKLGESGKKIDLVISHHPSGGGLARLAEVMPMQAEILALYGIPINVAESLLDLRMSEVARGVGTANHFKTVDAAKNLGIPYICLHTVTDNLVARFLHDLVTKSQPRYVSDIMDLFKKLPEYRESERRGAGPKIFAGNPDRRAGKIALTEITGGTSGSAKVYEVMASSGVGTILGMHMSEEHKKEAEAAHLNVIIAGHMSSDSLGMNLFLDELEKKGIEIVPCSGLIRVSRIAQKVRRT